MLQLAGERLKNRPEHFRGIQVNQRFTNLYVLQNAGWGDRVDKGTTVGYYQLDYADNTSATLPIAGGEDVWHWMGPPKGLPQATVGWVGGSRGMRKKPVTVSLHVRKWTNPHPQKIVTHIDYVSTMTEAAPFCVAMTVEDAVGPAEAEHEDVPPSEDPAPSNEKPIDRAEPPAEKSPSETRP